MSTISKTIELKKKKRSSESNLKMKRGLSDSVSIGQKRAGQVSRGASRINSSQQSQLKVDNGRDVRKLRGKLFVI